jgi:hypothetical protein
MSKPLLLVVIVCCLPAPSVAATVGPGFLHGMNTGVSMCSHCPVMVPADPVTRPLAGRPVLGGYLLLIGRCLVSFSSEQDEEAAQHMVCQTCRMQDVMGKQLGFTSPTPTVNRHFMIASAHQAPLFQHCTKGDRYRGRSVKPCYLSISLFNHPRPLPPCSTSRWAESRSTFVGQMARHCFMVAAVVSAVLLLFSTGEIPGF